LNVTSAAEVLRPIGLGELLDRAVTLGVRFFVPLVSLYVVYVVPYAIGRYVATHGHRSSSMLGAIIHMETAGGRPFDPGVVSTVLGRHSFFTPWFAFALLAAIFIAPLPSAALTENTSAFYLGIAPTFVHGYRVAFERWLPLVGLNLLYLGAGIALCVVFDIIAFAIVLAAAGLLTVIAHDIGIASAAIAGTVGLLAALAVAVIFLLAYEISYYTCVVERVPALQAFTLGLARVLRRGGLRRTLFVGSAYIAIYIGWLVIAAIGAELIRIVVHSTALRPLYFLLQTIAVEPFFRALLAVFYFDLRVREEGFDLQAAAQNLRSTSFAAT